MVRYFRILIQGTGTQNFCGAVYLNKALHQTACPMRSIPAREFSRKEAPSGPLIAPSFRFALIEYSKPYKKSYGFTKKHVLDTSFVPPAYLPLHKRIVDSRDQIHAHTDLTVLDAMLYISQSQDHRFRGIVQNKISGMEEFQNINQILAMIEGTLDDMYVKEKEIESVLPA